MMSSAPPLLFLPGASGDRALFHSVGSHLRTTGERIFLGYPGFGDTPRDPAVQGLDDLLAYVLRSLDRPAHLIAQSMGGVLALRAALARPERVQSLVLTGTSGGLDVRALGGTDWREDFLSHFPDAPDWFTHERSDLTERIAHVRAPVQLIWGTRDPISPVAVGERLRAVLPNARLVLIEGGEHDFPATHPAEVAALIDAHLARWEVNARV